MVTTVLDIYRVILTTALFLCWGFKQYYINAYKMHVQCHRNKIHMGGGGGGGWLPIVFLLIQYTVIKEAYYSLTIIWGAPAQAPPTFILRHQLSSRFLLTYFKSDFFHCSSKIRWIAADVKLNFGNSVI